MRVLVTGGAGFIGSHFVERLLQGHSDWEIVNLDALTYAGSAENLAGFEELPGYRFVRGDICDAELVESLFREGIDLVAHLAAESHVDRSLEDPCRFIRTNVEGTQVLLNAARRHGVERFLQVSTDEVYGPLESGEAEEGSPLNPSSPYAASKAAGDLLALAAHRTWGLPVVVTRSANNYGPRQHPEKLIPRMTLRALRELSLPVYGDGLQVRDWLWVEDQCRALELALVLGRPGEVYNIPGGCELSNLELLGKILERLGKPASLIRHVADRPGHDRRYAMSGEKARRELEYEPETPFEEGLIRTLRWYEEHRERWPSEVY